MVGPAERRLRGEQVRGADLHRRGPEDERCGNTARIADSAGGDYRDAHCVHHLRDQGQRADLAAQVRSQEHSPVPAGLIPHGDNRVATVPLQPDRFLDCGGRGQHLGPGRLDTFQQAFFRQAEMKAHDLGAVLLHHFATGRVERGAIGDRCRRIKIGAQLTVVGFQQGLPVAIAFLIGLRRLMAEEIDVDRPGAGMAHGGQGFVQLLDAQHRRRDRTQRAGLVGGNHHGGAGRTGHRCLDDGHVDAQQVENTGVWPGAHGTCLQYQLGLSLF